MPTYELACKDCGRDFERFLTRILRDEDKVCPACGSRSVRQGVGGGYGLALTGRSGETCVPRGGFG